MSLGRKQRIDNSAWLEAVATIEEAVSRAELDELTAATVADIKAVTAGSVLPTHGALVRTALSLANSVKRPASPIA